MFSETKALYKLYKLTFLLTAGDFEQSGAAVTVVFTVL